MARLRAGLLEGAIRSSWFAALLTLGIILAGLLGSLYADEIRSTVPFSWLPSLASKVDAIVLEAVLFWGLGLLLAFGFWHRQRSMDAGRTEAERRLIEALSILRGFMTHEVMSCFLELHRTALGSFLALRARPTSEAANADPAGGREPEASELPEPYTAFMTILSAVLELARIMDDRQAEASREGVDYSINVMEYRPTAEIAADWSSVRDRLRFVVHEVLTGGPETLNGILDLRIELSTATYTDADVWDHKLRDLALPIPKKVGDPQGRWLVLPGAPLAFVDRAPNRYRDTTEMAQWCRDSGGFRSSVVEAVDAYFDDDALPIRSLVSIPLVVGDSLEDAEEAVCVGVLNIHANTTGLLENPAALRQFHDLTQPFIALLVEILLDHNEALRACREIVTRRFPRPA